MAGTPSGVPGTLIRRLSRDTVFQSRRASGDGGLGVVGQVGRHFQADVTVPALGLVVNRPQHVRRIPGCRGWRWLRRPPWGPRTHPRPARRSRHHSRRCPAMAFSKIAGFEVTPLSPSSSTIRFSSPPVRSFRCMKSNQTDCPNSFNSFNGFMFPPGLVWCLTKTLTNLRVLLAVGSALLFLAWCPPPGGDRHSPLQVIAPCRQPKCPRIFITVFVRHHTTANGRSDPWPRRPRRPR